MIYLFWFTWTQQEPDETQQPKKSQSKPKPRKVMPSRPVSKKILLMGDSIITNINKKGLKDKVYKHGISGATKDTLVQEIEVYDLQNFSHIILYIGGNNVSNWTNNKYFKEKYDELISFIKEKNKNCQMLLVNSCPRGDTDVSAINDIICSLTEQYKIELVDAHNAFFNKKQELIQKYYYRDEIHLSDSGVKSLVGTISKRLDIVDNYSNCVFSATKQTNGRYKLRIRKTNETHDTWEADRWNKSSF